MCDYSLHATASRPARVGERLVSTVFPHTRTRGFASVDDLNTAATDLTDYNLLADAQKQIDSAFEAADKSDTTPASDTAAIENSPPADTSSSEPDEPAPKKQAGSGA